MQTLSRSNMKWHLLPALIGLAGYNSPILGDFYGGPRFDGNVQPPSKNDWESNKCRVGTRANLSPTASEKRKKLKAIAKKSKKRNRK